MRQVIDQLGYTPHFGGRALVSNRSNTVGAVIPTMNNSMFARGLQAFEETLSGAGVNLLVASSGYEPDREFAQIRTLVGRGTDALLLIGAARPQATYEFLKRRRIPYVITSTYRKHGNACYVGFDNRQSALEMTRQVIARGHRRFGIIAGITHNNDRAADRIEGMRAAFEEAGIPADEVPIEEARYSLAGGRRACAALLAREPRPTVLICGNDVLAVGAMLQARSLGLSLPADLSVTGFDDIELAEIIEPGLTTVHVPHRRMGDAAARALLSILDGDTACRGMELQTQLVIRDSLAPPPR